MAKKSEPTAALLSVTGPFWHGRNLRRFLLVLIPFGLTSALTYKMLSGQWYNVHPASYAPWVLGGSFLFPLNVFQVPVQVLILGLLLSLLIIVPILAAQSFGLAPTVFFVACVFFLAHLPIMAFFLLAAIFLAASPPLLRRSRFYSALLALVPMIAYLFLAAQVVLAEAGPAYTGSAVLSKNLLTGILLQLVSPTAVCIVFPIFMLVAFLAGLPSVLWRSSLRSSALVLIPIGAYLAGSVFVFIHSGDYVTGWPLRSAAELIWPEISLAGETSRQSLLTLSPIQQTWLYAPALVAVCSALILLALLFLAARWTSERAVVLALATTILTVLAIILFSHAVGPETLDYAILKARFEPNSALLRDFPALKEYNQRLEQYRLASDPSFRLQVEGQLVGLQDLLRLATETDRIPELKGQIYQLERRLRHARQSGRPAALRRAIESVLRRVVSQFEKRIAIAKRDCRKFLKTYPYSRHKPHVLYIKALALDARIDQERLRRQGTVYVYYEFPSPESKAIWQQLLRDYSESVLACPGGLSLARLLAREGRFDSALQVLRRAHEAGRGFLDSPSSARPGGFLTAHLGLPTAEPISQEQVSNSLRQIERLSDLIAANYRDPAYGSEPLRRFFTNDSQGSDYVQRIEDIRAEFPDALVADNIWLQVVLAQPVSGRLALLQSAASEFAGRDAGREALFHLAQLELTLAEQDPQDEHLRHKAGEHLRRFLQSYPHSYQAPLVRQQLARPSLLISPNQ